MLIIYANLRFIRWIINGPILLSLFRFRDVVGQAHGALSRVFEKKPTDIMGIQGDHPPSVTPKQQIGIGP